MLNLLQATKSELVEVRIEALKEEIFYAIIKIRTGKETQEIDARPSDALALAVLAKCKQYPFEWTRSPIRVIGCCTPGMHHSGHAAAND